MYLAAFDLTFFTFFTTYAVAEGLSTTPKLLLTVATVEPDRERLNSYQNEPKCWHTEEISPMPANRAATEMKLICRALELAGVAPTIQFRFYPNYNRALVSVKAGREDIFGESMWRGDPESTGMLLTAPVIRKGEFFKGFYRPKARKNFPVIKSFDDIKKLRTAISHQWTYDLKALREAGIEPYDAPPGPYLPSMLKQGRADLTLMSFGSGPGMNTSWNNIELVPVPGFKILLNRSRSFAVSEKSKNAERLHALLNIGIEKMRQTGEIRQSFEDVGIFPNHINDWIVVNPPKQ